MEHNIRWLVENKVIIANPKGNPSVEDLKLVSATLRKHIDASDAPLVHVLIDEGELGSMPISVKVLTDTIDVMRHPRLGWFIIYGTDDPVKKFLSSMVTQVTRVRHRRFITLRECLNFVTTMDTTLPSIEEILT